MKSDAGNALFLILIAVALFAALSYAITQSGRGGGNIDREEAELIAAQIMQYGTSISTTVSRMLLRGVSLERIAFESPLIVRSDGSELYPAGHNPNCVENGCQVFQPEGGGENVQILKRGVISNFQMVVPGTPYFVARPIAGVGTNELELAFHIPGLEKEVCKAINRKFGTGGADGEPLLENDILGESYDGSFPAPSGDYIGDNAAALVGKEAFCLWRDNSYWAVASPPDFYNYYQVMVAR